MKSWLFIYKAWLLVYKNLLGFAIQIVDYLQSGGVCPEEFAVGLHNEFQPLEGHDIGQFPGLESKEKEDLQTYQLTNWIHKQAMETSEFS